MDNKQEIDEIGEDASWGFWKAVLAVSLIGYVVFLIYGNLHRDGAILRDVRPAFLFADAFFRTLFTVIVALLLALVARVLHRATKKVFIVTFVVWGLFTMYSLWDTSPY